MKYTCFQTIGDFDLSAVETFGLHAKPNTQNPIGHFGTGLKYAIAVLMRHGCSIQLWCNGTHYSFYTKPKMFRGKMHTMVRIKKQTGLIRKYIELPFSTELGKGWELWMAFRELYSNTLDEEGGAISIIEQEPETLNGLKPEYTYIFIGGEDFAQVAEFKDTVFLPKERVPLIKTPTLSIKEGGAKHLYYKRMRAKDLDKPTLFTYNYTAPLELTEDRTIKNEYHVRYAVIEAIMKSEDPKVIRTVLTAPKDNYEHDLSYEHMGFVASKTFNDTVRQLKLEKHGSVNHSAIRYYHNEVDPPKKALVSSEIWEKIQVACESARQNTNGDSFTDEQIRDEYILQIGLTLECINEDSMTPKNVLAVYTTDDGDPIPF